MANKLSSLSTSWTLIQQAHHGSENEAAKAQELLLQRYGGAVRRYLLGIVREQHAAEELSQEFGLALVGKQFRNASPERGRFRNYVKMVLRHLVHKYHKKKNRRRESVSHEMFDRLADSSESDEFDGEFDNSWREQLLGRTWEALEQVQPSFFAVLRCRVDHKDASSDDMARILSQRLGKSITADNVRQTLRRARQKFGDLLLHEVGCSLDTPTLDGIEEELRDLRLFDYCKSALERYRKHSS